MDTAELLAQLSTRVEGLAKIQQEINGDVKETKEEVAKLNRLMFGTNGTPGHEERMRSLERSYEQAADAIKWGARGIVGILGAMLLLVAGAIIDVYKPLMAHVEQTPVAMVSSPTAVHEPTPTASNTPTPSVTPTPRPTYTPTPIPRTYAEIESAAALCWVECREMQEMRGTCCASVLDTVQTRIEQDKMTDGTFIGTLRYGCDEETINCQFPAYVTRGCDGISSACPFDDEDGLTFFRRLVRLYWDDVLEPWCDHFLFYDLGLDDAECEIRTKNGQFLIFHGKVEHDEE